MLLPKHKTKIVATIGPSSESPEMLERLIRAGMSIARLNFSHGDFEGHARCIAAIRAAERVSGRRVSILADLPGPKMRIGKCEPDSIVLNPGDLFTLASGEFVGDKRRVSVSFDGLPRAVKPGDRLFLNDGLVQLAVERVEGGEVQCKTVIGGELRSNKGINLPGIDLGIGAFTKRDRECLEFALKHGIDAVGQSFVESAADIDDVREAAASLGKSPFVIAKIERLSALERFDEILEAADGIMIARGDLGVEVPIEQIAITQKQLIAKSNSAGKPVITATQMLESMVWSRLPTRAEATDVANAILDGTDCVMLSGESAMGKYPAEAVAMLGRIAAVTESHRRPQPIAHKPLEQGSVCASDPDAEAIASLVEHALESIGCAAVFVPTRTGRTARMISRHRPSVWVVSVSTDPTVCQALVFSWGVIPQRAGEDPGNWSDYANRWLAEHEVQGRLAMLTTGPSPRNPDASYRIEIMRLD